MKISILCLSEISQQAFQKCRSNLPIQDIWFQEPLWLPNLQFSYFTKAVSYHGNKASNLIFSYGFGSQTFSLFAFI